MRELKQVTVIGLGLLGGSITLRVLRSFSGVTAIGFAHRDATRRKARRLSVASQISGDIAGCVADADIVILATPKGTFECIFRDIAPFLPAGCIVTDVGSTKVLPHRWAAEYLPDSVYYVGSHPIAGSEQRGVEFARDDLFEKADCIITTTGKTDRRAVGVLKKFWSRLGCRVKFMTPAGHDRIFANVSHLPHLTAAALINANSIKDLQYSGKGFMDTSRVASGPANIWSDVLMANSKNISAGIDRITAELHKLKKAVQDGNESEIERLLEAARNKRSQLINRKISKEIS